MSLEQFWRGIKSLKILEDSEHVNKRRRVLNTLESVEKVLDKPAEVLMSLQ